MGILSMVTVRVPTIVDTAKCLQSVLSEKFVIDFRMRARKFLYSRMIELMMTTNVFVIVLVGMKKLANYLKRNIVPRSLSRQCVQSGLMDYGVYKLQGAINVQLAERTTFSEEDAVKIKNALCTIFENDASSARPEGSMEMSRFYWIEHSNKTGCAPSAKIHRSVSTQKKDGVETPSHLDDYIIDDSALYAIDGIRIEKYVEGSLVE